MENQFEIEGYQQEKILHKSKHIELSQGLCISDQKPVLLKTYGLPSKNESVVNRIRQEYQVHSSAKHESILKALDYLEDDGLHTIVFEHVDVKSLMEDLACNSGESLARKVIGFGIELAGILGDLHRQSIIHGNLDPQKILIDRSTSKMKLTGFSFQSGEFYEENGSYGVDFLPEELGFISPEQTGRTGHEIDSRTDIYSLGMSLYQLLTIDSSFKADQIINHRINHLTAELQPLNEINSDVPDILSEIVLKMVLKDPQDRYQSAFGLKSDLEKCLEHINSEKEPVDFVLGEDDRPNRFVLPKKLYGRDKELARLLKAIEEKNAEFCNAILISGEPGAGKTALVNDLKKKILRDDLLIVSGKCEQIKHNRPYKAISEGFQQLVDELLVLEEEEVIFWKEKMSQHLEPNYQILLEVIPHLEHILGPVTASEAVDLMQNQNFFEHLFRQFIHAFIDSNKVLLIVLDDMQWSDPSTLLLFENLLKEGEKGLIFVGTFRNNELDENHALGNFLRAVQKNQTQSLELELKPLSQNEIEQLITDNLPLDRNNTNHLARICHQKTNGNPFFLTRFLQRLYLDGYLSLFERVSMSEQESRSIRSIPITDNVADLVLNEVNGITEEYRLILSVAACIGHQFELSLLAKASQQPKAFVSKTLDLLERLNLVVSVEGPTESDPQTNHRNRICRFAHDRIWSEIYYSTDATRKDEFHFEIGRILLSEVYETNRDKYLYVVVDHLNRSNRVLQDESIRKRLIELNTIAGQRAVLQAAYFSASSYLKKAQQLLGPDGWEKDRKAANAITTYLAESEFLNGNIKGSIEYTNLIKEFAGTREEKIRCYNLEIRLLTLAGKNKEAISVMTKTLRLMGINILAVDYETAIIREQNEIDQQTAGKAIEDFVNLPLMSDWQSLLLMKTLMNAAAAALYENRQLFALITLMKVNLTLKHGCTPESCSGFAGYAILLKNVFGNDKRSLEIAQLALNLADRLKDSNQTSLTCNAAGSFIVSWYQPLQHAIEIHQKGYLSGRKVGQFMYAGYNLYNRVANEFIQGYPLKSIQKDLVSCLEFFEKTKNRLVCQFAVGLFKVVSDLISKRNGRNLSANFTFDEENFIKDCQDNQNFAPVFHYLTNKARNEWVFGNIEKALSKIGQATEFKESNINHISEAEFCFVETLCALETNHSGRLVGKVHKTITKNKEQISAWASQCKENFSHYLYIIEAKIALAENRRFEAIEYFEKAIDSAKANGFIQYVAISNELCASFLISQGMTKVATIYLQEAYKYYKEWEATEVVRQFEIRYRNLFIPTPQESSSIPLSIDYLSIMKASHALSGELILERLLRTLMKIVEDNAGAEKAYLVFKDYEEWIVKVDQTKLPLTDPQLDKILSSGVINYVLRTKEKILLENAYLSSQFRNDSYIQSKQSKSILGIPLIHRGGLIGVIYLENNLLSNAFNKQRVDMLNLLSTQIAISINHAQTYDRARKLSQQLLTVRDDERKKLSRNLHDHVGQSLLALKLNLQLLTAQLLESDQNVKQQLSEVIAEVSECIEEIRTLSEDLRPHFYEINLKAVIESKVVNLKNRFDIEFDVQFDQFDDPPAIIRDNLYGIFQEAMNNIIKHSEATLVKVSIMKEHEHLKMTIQDNGIGFLPKSKDDFRKGLGFLTMQERAELFKGSIRVQSNLGVGTTIKVLAPHTDSI